MQQNKIIINGICYYICIIQGRAVLITKSSKVKFFEPSSLLFRQPIQKGTSTVQWDGGKMVFYSYKRQKTEHIERNSYKIHRKLLHGNGSSRAAV